MVVLDAVNNLSFYDLPLMFFNHVLGIIGMTINAIPTAVNMSGISSNQITPNITTKINPEYSAKEI